MSENNYLNELDPKQLKRFKFPIALHASEYDQKQLKRVIKGEYFLIFEREIRAELVRLGYAKRKSGQYSLHLYCSSDSLMEYCKEKIAFVKGSSPIAKIDYNKIAEFNKLKSNYNKNQTKY